jgi:NAD(P)-dependent dehydrogenase (short-subunit alcohol dehydrogenase family)
MNILPSFAKSEDARIICTTSCMQYLGRFDLSNANTTADPRSYCHNKLYLQTFLTELQSRLSKVPSMSHVALHGVHPGYVDTGIWTRVQATGKEEASPQNFGERLDNLLVHYFGVTPQQGSLAIVRAATAKECAVSQRGGEGGARYFNRIWPAVPMPQTVSPVYGQQIWDYIDEQLHLEEKGLLDIFKDE